jgi:hypothetical protein
MLILKRIRKKRKNSNNITLIIVMVIKEVLIRTKYVSAIGSGHVFEQCLYHMDQSPYGHKYVT